MATMNHLKIGEFSLVFGSQFGFLDGFSSIFYPRPFSSRFMSSQTRKFLLENDDKIIRHAWREVGDSLRASFVAFSIERGMMTDVIEKDTISVPDYIVDRPAEKPSP